jgi:glycosyltransferase involved in cell wall biosynthesis
LPSLLRQQGISVHDVDPDGAAALVSSWRPHVISAHCPPLWWLDVADKARVPFVETLHGMHDLFDTDWSEEARRARRKSKLIAVSELVRQQYLRCNRGFDPARIVTVPNSVDPDRVAPVDRQAARAWLGLKDEFLFVSLARHALQKNGYALIESFADVAAAHPDAHLLIAGRPDNRLHMNQLLQLRARLDCRDRIHLRDHAPWSGALLAAADAFVMNSYFEGWSLATMEALAAGLPVISSDVGGAREQIGDDGSRGVVVPNPLGDPLAVNWQTLGEALYGPQVNRAALVAAMNEVVAARQAWSARRESLRAESLARFRPEHALGGHAQALRASATSQPELTEAS